MVMQGYQFYIFDWTLFGAVTVLACIRLYVQLRFRMRPWRELFVLLAWSLYLAQVILNTIQNEWDDTIGELDIPDNASDGNIDKLEEPMMKGYYAGAFIYKTSLYCCKAVLLCFYNDLTPRNRFPKTWWAIIVTWVFCGIGAAFQILVNLLDCWPFYLNWSYMNGECGYNSALFITSWSIFSLTDILVYFIPFVILGNVTSITPREKRAAYFMFAVGTFNVFLAIILLALYITNEFSDIIWNFVGPGYSIMLQVVESTMQGTGLIVICMPQARRLWLGTSAKAMRPRSEIVPRTRTTPYPMLPPRLGVLPDLEDRIELVRCTTNFANFPHLVERSITEDIGMGMLRNGGANTTSTL